MAKAPIKNIRISSVRKFTKINTDTGEYVERAK
jgi:hypothetical protein